MRMLYLLLIFVFLMFSSCSKSEKKAVLVENNPVTEEKKEKFVPFQPEDDFNMELTEYKVYGRLKPGYELGYDDNLHAYLTDLRTHKQIVFLCAAYDCRYTKDEFLHIYDDSIAADRDVKEGLAISINWCIDIAKKHETVWDEHFEFNIERYYVDYRDAYSFYHV